MTSITLPTYGSPFSSPNEKKRTTSRSKDMEVLDWSLWPGVDRFKLPAGIWTTSQPDTCRLDTYDGDSFYFYPDGTWYHATPIEPKAPQSNESKNTIENYFDKPGFIAANINRYFLGLDLVTSKFKYTYFRDSQGNIFRCLRTGIVRLILENKTVVNIWTFQFKGRVTNVQVSNRGHFTNLSKDAASTLEDWLYYHANEEGRNSLLRAVQMALGRFEMELMKKRSLDFLDDEEEEKDNVVCMDYDLDEYLDDIPIQKLAAKIENRKSVWKEEKEVEELGGRESKLQSPQGPPDLRDYRLRGKQYMGCGHFV